MAALFAIAENKSNFHHTHASTFSLLVFQWENDKGSKATMIEEILGEIIILIMFLTKQVIPKANKFNTEHKHLERAINKMKNT